jgi:hypothetical protein
VNRAHRSASPFNPLSLPARHRPPTSAACLAGHRPPPLRLSARRLTGALTPPPSSSSSVRRVDPHLLPHFPLYVGREAVERASTSPLFHPLAFHPPHFEARTRPPHLAFDHLPGFRRPKTHPPHRFSPRQSCCDPSPVRATHGPFSS